MTWHIICSKLELESRSTCFLLWINSGFSSVPEKMPKNANAALLAMSQAVHSLISLYICTLIAPSGWAYICIIKQLMNTNTEQSLRVTRLKLDLRSIYLFVLCLRPYVQNYKIIFLLKSKCFLHINAPYLQNKK